MEGKFRHDCQQCQFLGTIASRLGREGFVDLYVCGNVSESIVVRYGNEGPQYISGVDLCDQYPELEVARILAEKSGLLKKAEPEYLTAEEIGNIRTWLETETFGEKMVSTPRVTLEGMLATLERGERALDLLREIVANLFSVKNGREILEVTGLPDPFDRPTEGSSAYRWDLKKGWVLKDEAVAGEIEVRIG